MITYKWVVPALNCAVEKEGLTNVVEGIHWRYQGADENNNIEEIFGMQTIGEPNAESFTEYSGLTLEIVSGWLEAVLDVEDMQAKIAAKIANKVAPTNVVLPLPKDLGI